MFDGKFLQAALPGLVTDGAVEWMVDEEELHYAVAAFLYQLPARADPHVLRDGIGTGYDRPRHPGYFLVTIVLINRTLSGRRPVRHTHLNQTHTAISRR